MDTKNNAFLGLVRNDKKVGTKRPLNEGMKGRGYEMTVTPSVLPMLLPSVMYPNIITMFAQNEMMFAHNKMLLTC